MCRRATARRRKRSAPACPYLSPGRRDSRWRRALGGGSQSGWGVASSAASTCCLSRRNAASSIPVAASTVDHGTSRPRNPSMVSTLPLNSPSRAGLLLYHLAVDLQHLLRLVHQFCTSAPRRPSATHRRAPLRSRSRRPVAAPLRQRWPAALQDRPAPTPARQQRSSRCRPPNSPTARPRRPQPQRLAPAGMIRTVPLFRRSAPGTHSERNDHRHTPRHLSCNQPRLGARNATCYRVARRWRAPRGSTVST